jgi:nicotinamidase-related amidase
MLRQLLKKRRKYILVDVNTQKDFLLPQGNMCVKDHRKILTNIRRMMAWARRNDVRVISMCEVHPNHNGISAMCYCIDGTEGQKKIGYTLLSNRANFPADDNTDLPEDLLRQYRQIVLHNRSEDPFDEPRIERLLSEVRADVFVLIGASTEGAIKATALGLLQRGKDVSVVVDAVGGFDRREAKLAFRKMRAKGAKLIETRRLAGMSCLRKVGICGCKSCSGRVRTTSAKIGLKW